MILPKIIELASDTNYLHRMTCLFCFNVLCESLGEQSIIHEMFPTIRKLSEDVVPNVRFNVAKTLTHIGKIINQK